jgi:hypothetical protein
MNMTSGTRSQRFVLAGFWLSDLRKASSSFPCQPSLVSASEFFGTYPADALLAQLWFAASASLSLSRTTPI